MTYSENYDLENAVEETKFFLLQQYDSIETVKNTVRDIISSAGLVIALLSLLQISFDNLNLNAPGGKEYMLFLAVGLYVVMVGIGVFLLMPVVMRTPMLIEKETFEKLFYNKPPKRILENKLANYLNAANENRPILRRASSLSKTIGIIYISIIVLLIASLIF